MIEALDTLLKDLMNTKALFRGKIIQVEISDDELRACYMPNSFLAGVAVFKWLQLIGMHKRRTTLDGTEYNLLLLDTEGIDAYDQTNLVVIKEENQYGTKLNFKQFNLFSDLYNSHFQECQIKAVLYADEIEQYAEMLKLMNTYLISTARVKISQTSHGKPIHKFYWVLDKETVIEHITPSNGVENPLPPPTKLNLTTFDRIPHMMLDSALEIDILAIVLRCSPQKYAGRTNHKGREIIICDNQ
uniref:Uncharacterized protein n=1 Tax=Solanum lycopersicum TaxID=4081 RepID=A0A3Q7EY64_SOLLC